MRTLRTLEEASKQPRTMSWDRRREIIERLRALLGVRREVALAVIHGGFISSRVFRDIDVAIFTGHRIPLDKEHVYILRISDELARVAEGIYVDVTLLDNAPPQFIVSSLSNCIVLVERLPGLRLHLLARAMDDVRKLKQRKARRESRV